jgi:hypothetical protein
MRHFQVIWLLARGHTIADVAAVTSFVPRWIEQLLARYNAHGPEALGDLRRRNGGVPSVLRPALLERLRARLEAPPPDGGLWSSRTVAAWMAGELGLAAVLPQRGWDVTTHAPDSGAQALMVVRMVPKTEVADVRRAVSTTVRTAASPSAAHMAR